LVGVAAAVTARLTAYPAVALAKYQPRMSDRHALHLHVETVAGGGRSKKQRNVLNDNDIASTSALDNNAAATSSISTSSSMIPPLPLESLLSQSNEAMSVPPADPDQFALGRSGLKDGDVSEALFNEPNGIALHTNPTTGELIGMFVADTGNHALRYVDLRSGKVRTIACREEQRKELVISSQHDDNQQQQAAPSSPSSTSSQASSFPIAIPFSSPSCIVLDPLGSGSSLLVADTGNHCIRKIHLSHLHSLSSTNAPSDASSSIQLNGKKLHEIIAGGNERDAENEGDEPPEPDPDTEAELCTTNAPEEGSSSHRRSRPSTASLSRPSTASSSLRAVTVSPLRAPSRPRVSRPSVPASSARFSFPSCLEWDASNNLLICDRGNARIKIMTTMGMVTSLPSPPFDIRLKSPRCIVRDTRGNTFVSDVDNHCIYRVDEDGVWSIYAGTYRRKGYRDGIASKSLFNSPWGLAVDPRGSNALFVADSDNQCTRIIWPHGVVSTLVGGGLGEGVADEFHQEHQMMTSARTSRPLSAMASHRSYSDRPPPSPFSAHRSLAGSSSLEADSSIEPEEGFIDGPASVARFYRPRGLAFHAPSNRLFIADMGNHAIRCVRVRMNASEGGAHGADGSNITSLASLSADAMPSARERLNDLTDLPSTANSTSTSDAHYQQLTRHASLPPFRPSTASTAMPSRNAAFTQRPSTAKQHNQLDDPPTSRLQRVAATSSIAFAALSGLSSPVSPAVHPESWSCIDVGFWLVGLESSFEKYVSAFFQHKVDGATLLDANRLNERSLRKQLGVASKMHRNRIWRAIMNLRNPGEEQSDEDEDENATSNVDDDHDSNIVDEPSHSVSASPRTPISRSIGEMGSPSRPMSAVVTSRSMSLNRSPSSSMAPSRSPSRPASSSISGLARPQTASGSRNSSGIGWRSPLSTSTNANTPASLNVFMSQLAARVGDDDKLFTHATGAAAVAAGSSPSLGSAAEE